MLQRLSFLLLYSTLILISITFCNGGNPGKKEKKKLVKDEGDDEGNANAIKFLHSIHPHFGHFGTPFELLEQEKDYIIKRNARTKKVEWRLAEINQYTIIREWTSEFSMFDERNAGIEKKVLSPAMTEYANCVKKLEKMKIKNDRTTKIFMLNGAITVLDMKQIAGKRHAFRVKYVPEFMDEEQIIDVVPTHFCASLFIVENWKKIGEHELVCTRIDRWTEKDGPPRNIGKMKDCGHSVLYDNHLDEYLVNSGAENMLEFVQIKLAMDLTKMLKRLEAANLIVGNKKDHQNVPSASITVADEHQIKRMDPNLRIYKGFMVEYDPRKLVANWLLERLTMENALSKFSPKRLKWNADPKLAEKFQPDDADYQIAKQFKLNHGHLAGFRAHKNVGQETFLYPNSVPQDREMNSGYWRVIEEYALCLAGHKQSIAYVYTGPLYIPERNTDTGQWHMKYKVIGMRKMMAVPTHLFKVIFLEFTNNTDGKKSFWLESLVVSNGQRRDEEDEEGREEEEAVEEEFEVEEEEEAIQVEIQMGNNEWYILAKDEAEIDKILKESHKPDKVKEKSPETNVITSKKTESIQALVKGCQNRSYNIIYGDANSSDQIDELLKRHRVPIAYIDKFAPNFKLLEKLPPQLRSRPYGFHFDDDKLVEFISINEKGKDMVEELSNSSNEKEEKRNSEEREEETSHSSIKFGSAKGKGAKRKGGKSKKKKQQQQERKAPAFVFHFAEGTINTAEFNSEKLLQQFFNQMEELYTKYLFNTKLNYSMQIHLFNSILLYTRWNGALSMLQIVKATMSTEGNMIGAAQINDIQLELFKTIKEKRFLEINKTMLGSNETAKLAEINICWLIHLRESIFNTFFSSSSQQKSSILLKLEQNRWRNYGILPGAKGEENILSNLSNDDGKKIAQIWMESADNYCRQNEKQAIDFVFKFKREMHRQQSVTLHKLMKMENIGLAKKFENFFVKNDAKSRIINETNLKFIQLLGVHFFKEFVKEFPNLTIIAPSNFNTFHESIFREVIFDIELFVGYQSQKYALQELLQFFDFYTIMNEIEQIPKKYTARIRRKLFHELNNHKQNLIDNLFHCQELEENNEISPTLRQVLAGRCMLDVFCQVQNLFHEINERTAELDFMNIQSDLHYYGVEECERMITLRGRTLSAVLSDKPKLSTDFYEKYANFYDESIKNLMKWSFGILDMRMGEIVDESVAKVEWFMYEGPNTDFEYRKVQLAINQKAETFAFDLQPHLLDTSLVDWQTVQATLVLPSIEKTITHLFADLNPPKKPVVVNLANREQAVENALKIVGNVQKFVALEKIFEEISEKSKKMEIEPMHELCQLLFIKQNLLFSMKNIDEKEHRNNPHLQNLIGQIDEIYISKFPYDDDEEVTVGSTITMESLDGFCQNVDKRQKLFQKYRHVIEILVTKELQDVFFTKSFGMTNYHLMVELPAKLIKMTGVTGFMEIARKHPLIMTNFFNLKTVDAISYQNDIINNENTEKEGEQRENEKILAEIKTIIMLDLILFQLKLAAKLHQNEETSAGEQENETLLNEKFEKRNKIERAKAEGMDILMEWLDNSDSEKTIINMKTNEKKELHMNKVDEKAYMAIGQLIIGNEENSIPIELEIGSVTDEKWRREWRKSTMAKLLELEEGKKSDKKGKEKEEIEEEKGKIRENIAISSSESSLSHH